MDVKIYNNFLSDKQIEELKSIILSDTFPWYYQEKVASHDHEVSALDYYHTHGLYSEDRPISYLFDSIYDIIVSKIKEVVEYHTLLRIKVNCYPYTEIVKQHSEHVDYNYTHQLLHGNKLPVYGGILSLNTCNGFTRLFNGTMIDSVENRFFIFDSSKPHNSSTTSDCKRRVNININWI